MKSPITNRERLLELTAATLQSLRDDQILESAGTADAAAINRLEAALQWADQEDVEAHPSLETVESGFVEPYIPSNATLSLMQSAYDEFVQEKKDVGLPIPFDPATDPGFKTIVAEKLKAAQRGAHSFIRHETLESFRYDLPEDAVVALFADWGTGETTAQRVMDQIRLHNPTHAIHLGDVDYAGTPGEVKSRFLDIIAAHGPSESTCKYFALPGNHDMYSGGYAYFDSVIPFCGIQEASYFNLRNEHWQLIGLDSGYNEYDLHEPQSEWLGAQLASAPSPRSSIVFVASPTFLAVRQASARPAAARKGEVLSAGCLCLVLGPRTSLRGYERSHGHQGPLHRPRRDANESTVRSSSVSRRAGSAHGRTDLAEVLTAESFTALCSCVSRVRGSICRTSMSSATSSSPNSLPKALRRQDVSTLSSLHFSIPQTRPSRALARSRA